MTEINKPLLKLARASLLWPALVHAMLVGFPANSLGFDDRVLNKDQVASSSLIQSVNIIYQRDKNGNLIQKDPRETLKQAGSKVGLTSREIKAISKNMAKIYCNDDKEGMGYTTASVVAYQDILITAAHVFYAEDGTPRRPCFYQLLAPPYTMSDLPVSDDNVKVYSKDPYHKRYQDKAIVRLPHLIASSEPFALSGNQNAIKVGESYINVSANQEGMESRAKSTEVVVQNCHAQNVFATNPRRPAVVFSDCSGTPGSCGAINLVRINGGLQISSLQIDSGKSNRNYQPYDFNLVDGGRSMSVSVAIDPEMIEEIRLMSHDPAARTEPMP